MRGQREGQVRGWKQNEQARDTHRLKNAERETGQDTETIRASKGYLLPEKPRGSDKSGRRNNTSEQRALTI